MTANIIATLALLVSLGAAIVAFWQGKSAREAAEQARRSADSAAAVERAEVERDHRDMHPRDPGGQFVYETSELGGGRLSLFYVFTPERTYRAAGEPRDDERSSKGTAQIGPVLEAGKPVKVHVDDMSRRDKSMWSTLQIRCWPPAAGDPGGDWTCPCGRNTDPSGEAHWVWNVPIVPPPKPPTPMVARR